MSDNNTLRRAVLVVHGIGEQRRYETLADFALGLIRYGLPQRFRKNGRNLYSELLDYYTQKGLQLFQQAWVILSEGIEVSVELFKFERSYDARVKLRIPPGPENEKQVETDIYESYWAPLTSGHTNLFRVLFWLVSTTWVTLKNGLIPTDRKPRFGEFLTELVRLVLVFGLLIATLGGVYWGIRGLLKSFTGFEGNFWAHYDVWYFILLIIWIFFSFLAVQFVQGLLFRTAKLSWFQSAIVAVLIGAFGWWIWSADYNGLRGEVWWFTLLVFLCVLLRTVFVDYLGDVEVYVSGNESGRNRKVRREIIGHCRAKLEHILQRKAPKDKPYHTDSPYYDEIVIVGHSLGSVIAYDVLCRLLRPEGGAISIDARKRIRHFYTVGSPLDKIWYFFRDRSHAQNPIYQGILVKLKGVKSVGDHDSPLADLDWTNLWTFTDVVSGELEEYGDQVVNIHLPSLLWPPLVNHVRYWTSSQVMRRIGARVFQAS